MSDAETHKPAEHEEELEQTYEQEEQHFIIAPEEKYECIQCAGCCSDYWEIVVDDQSVERLKDIDLGRIRPALKYHEPFKKSAVVPERRVIQQIEGRCCFLVKQHLCGLEYYYDHEAKPRVCRQFPFRFASTPDGVYVNASFACTAVQHNEGIPLTEQENAIREAYKTAIKVPTIPPEIKLDDDITLHWDTYRKVETGLLELLDIETLPLTTLLIAGNVYLDLLGEFIREVIHRGDYSIEEAVDSYLELMRKQHFGKPIDIATNMKPAPRLQRIYIGMLVSFRNTIAKKRSYFATVAFWMRQYLMNVMGLGKFRILPVQQTFRMSDFNTIRFSMDDPYTRHIIHRYVKQLIFSKQGLENMSLKKAYRFILLYFALIRWDAVAHAVDAQLHEVDRNCILQAVSNVEQYYVRHTDMEDFFTSNPYLDTLLDNFMNNKRFAATMVLPPA